MYDDYRSGPRDGGGYRSSSGRRSPRRRDDDRDRDRDYYHSRKDSRSPPRKPRYYDQDQPSADYRAHTSNNGRDARGHGYDAGDLYDDGPSRLPHDHYGTREGHNRVLRDPLPGQHRSSTYGGHDDRATPGGSPGRGDFPERHTRDLHRESRNLGHLPRFRPYGESSCLILGGLPDDIIEDDILSGLDYVAGDPRLSSEQIKSVRIRSSRRGSRIAFVEFHRLSDATRFYDDYNPEISLPLRRSSGTDSEPIVVTIDYSRPRDDSDRHAALSEDQGWECISCGGMNYPHRAACYKCKAERPDTTEGFSSYGAPYGGPILTGETDEDLKQNPSQFVVIRDLETSVTEELLAKGVMKLFREEQPQPAKDSTKPGNKLKSTAPTNSSAGLGAAPGSLRRVFLIRDKRTNESWKYGFAEFATIDDARGAVAKFNASPRFTIASKPVIIAFSHTGVFVPITEPVTEQTAKFSFAPIYNPSLRVKYWDDRAYPSEHIVSATSDLLPAGEDVPEKLQTPEKASSAAQDSAAKRKKDKEALAAKIAAKKALVMGPQMQMWAKKAAEIHGKSQKGDDEQAEPLASHAPEDPAAEGGLSAARAQKPTAPVAPSWRDQYVSYADWDTIECLLCGKFSAEEWLIYHETHVHNHYKDEEVKAKAAALLASRKKEPRTVTRRTPRRKCDDLQPYTSYADQDSLICYLCTRKLPNVRVLHRHEQESELHKKNLGEASKVDKARARLAELDLKPVKMVPLGYDGPVRRGPQYRDRAKERRQVYNQPNKPAPPRPDAHKRKTVEDTPAGEAEGPTAKKSKGAGLLAKMGWTAGEGLGAAGDGRTEAVGAEAYVPGVGLGAEGGKLGDAAEEAARKTKGDMGGFIEKTRERARERFEKLQ